MVQYDIHFYYLTISISSYLYNINEKICKLHNYIQNNQQLYRGQAL